MMKETISPAESLSTLDPVARPARHPILFDRPAVEFFEGAVLGNGGLGAVVTTRPDTVIIHFGHNNVWDIRLAEEHRDKIGIFQEIFDRVKEISPGLESLKDDPWFREYSHLMEENYRKPYPRPFPCGSLALGFDRRRAELLGHRLDISAGRCEVNFLVEGQVRTLQLFVDMAADRLWLQLVDEGGRPAPSIFYRIRLMPDPDTPAEFPTFTRLDNLPAGSLAFRQVLPAQEPHDYDPAAGHPKDRAFLLALRVEGEFDPEGKSRSGHVSDMIDIYAGVSRGPFSERAERLERWLKPGAPFTACVQLDEGLASEVGPDAAGLPQPDWESFEAAAAASRQAWQLYWQRSGVALADEFLERTWYWNLYFFNCAVKAGVTCPGLFANWSYRQIGTAWHGDYHMNYNTQQPFWVAFSSNHVDKHLPYVELVHHLLPVSRKWAREYYGLRGAYFPHSAYPVEMNIMPYPVPTWGWELCETPWTVQSLWWHYLYTMDRQFLAGRAFEPIKEAVLFLVDYLRRPEAHGEAWGDDKYHVFPTVSPELYELTPHFKLNYDCLVDLTLIKFVFKAYLAACRVLERETTEAGLMEAVRDVLDHLPAYPTAESQRGQVFVSVPGEDPEVVYNTPNSTMTVFPGEDHGLHSPPDEYEIAANSYRNQNNEGGNELVFYHLQGARLGLLDLERFKRQIRYCLMPNGTCTDKLLQVGGRYNDYTPYDFMARMGLWFENMSLPVVINECLLQSYTGVLRFFPNWPADQDAEFRTLRAAGAFLVSAALQQGRVQWVEIFSEAGSPLRLLLPWAEGAICASRAGERPVGPGLLELETTPGETIRLRPGK